MQLAYDYTAKTRKGSFTDPGAVSRPDAYVEQNTTLQMRQQYNACVAAGYAGAALRQCAAPKAGGAFTAP